MHRFKSCFLICGKCQVIFVPLKMCINVLNIVEIKRFIVFVYIISKYKWRLFFYKFC